MNPGGGNFDPEALAAIHDAPEDEPPGWVLRRGLRIAADLAEPMVVRGALWIDAGCGPGHLAARLDARGARAVGVDRDVAMIAYAARRWHRPARPPLFVVADAARLPFPDGAAAGIVAVSLLGCLAEPLPFLTEAARVLRPGGILVATATNAASMSVLADRVLSVLPGLRPTAARPGKGPRGFRLHRAADLRAAFEVAGLRVNRVVEYGDLPPERFRTAASHARARTRERTVHGARDFRPRARNFLLVGARA